MYEANENEFWIQNMTLNLICLILDMPEANENGFWIQNMTLNFE